MLIVESWSPLSHVSEKGIDEIFYLNRVEI